MVALVDGLEGQGLLERQRDAQDRRHYALHLTRAGERLLGRLAGVAQLHDDELTASLDAKEKALLRDLLGRIAEAQGLTPGVHPGYRDGQAVAPRGR